MCSVAPRRILWIAWVCLLVARLAGAAGTSLSADFDGDGRDDRATLVQHHARPVVQVWLSTTRAMSVLRIDAPVAAIAAADLDGDRRDELIVGGARASLHVWTVRHRALERVEARARVHTAGQHTVCGVGDPHDRETSIESSSVPVGAAPGNAPQLHAPGASAVRVLHEDVAGQLPALASPLGPRPPPASR